MPPFVASTLVGCVRDVCPECASCVRLARRAALFLRAVALLLLARADARERAAFVTFLRGFGLDRRAFFGAALGVMCAPCPSCCAAAGALAKQTARASIKARKNRGLFSVDGMKILIFPSPLKYSARTLGPSLGDMVGLWFRTRGCAPPAAGAVGGTKGGLDEKDAVEDVEA